MPVASVLTFFLDDCSVLTISERTRASITQASDAVFVPAKVFDEKEKKIVNISHDHFL